MVHLNRLARCFSEGHRIAFWGVSLDFAEQFLVPIFDEDDRANG